VLGPGELLDNGMVTVDLLIIVGIKDEIDLVSAKDLVKGCLLYTSPSPRDRQKSRMPSSA
jgi:hypothetical protein